VPGDDAGRRRNAGGVDAQELVGVRQDLAELAREHLDLGRIELDLGEPGDRSDLFGRKHGRILP